MLFWEYVFWICCFVVFYNYAGYAIIVFLLNRLGFGRKNAAAVDYFPSVSFIVAAYNEEDCIETKIINSLEQHYPANKIEYIFITDGSTDQTPELVRKYPGVRLLHHNERKGKTAALNRAVAAAKNEVLIFSDANTHLNRNACANIARHYQQNCVGGVAGEKKVIAPESAEKDATGGEGLYWKYESLLKKLDSDFFSVVGAAGELFSVRKSLYEDVSPQVILDDFIISMKVAAKGYTIVYEPDAYAMELPSFSMKDERKRKVRISAGGFQAMRMLPQALAFWKHPKLSFLYVSHRVLRWAVSPLCLVLALLSSAALSFLQAGFFYTLMFIFQAFFYLCAAAYATLPGLGKKFSFLRLPFYFTFMNISVFEGFFKYIQKKQSSAWEKAKRTSQPMAEVNSPVSIHSERSEQG